MNRSFPKIRIALLTVLLAIKTWAVCGTAHAEKKPPALLVMCEEGGIHRIPDEANLGSGYNCVLHDRHGSSATAAAISIYDAEGSP